MKRVKNILSVLFWTTLAIAATMVIVFETNMVEPGVLVGASGNGEFLVTILMELLTLASVPLALKLFHFRRIRRDLVIRKESSLLRWGFIRLSMLSVLLVANTLLYYIYMCTAFGYMALIIVICLPFVYPSMDRCLTETEEEPEAEEKGTDEEPGTMESTQEEEEEQ